MPGDTRRAFAAFVFGALQFLQETISYDII